MKAAHSKKMRAKAGPIEPPSYYAPPEEVKPQEVEAPAEPKISEGSWKRRGKRSKQLDNPAEIESL